MTIEEGNFVWLREKTIEDARDDYSWRCDPELARFDAALPMRIPFAQFEAEYEYELRNGTPHRRRFAIDTLTGEHIGNCTYFNIDTRRKEAELGIVIGNKNHWGKGYGREAVTLLLKHIFESSDFERVYLYTLDWNLRAQASFKHCGFREVRRSVDGAYHFVIMEILREEFEHKFHQEERVSST